MPDSRVPLNLIAKDDVYNYAFVGNIFKIILTEDMNIHHHPYILASGITGNFDSNNLTFTLTPS